MGAGLWWFLRTRALFGTVGLRAPSGEPRAIARDWRILWIIVAVLALVALLLFTGVLQVAATTLSAHAMNVMLAATGAYFVYLLFFAGLTAAERRRIVVLLVLVMASTLFWAGYEQAGSSLTLFAERNTDRMIGSYRVSRRAGSSRCRPSACCCARRCSPACGCGWPRRAAIFP